MRSCIPLIASEHRLAVMVGLALGVASYFILRFIPIKKIPPLLAVLCLSGLYLGMGILSVWCIQVFKWSFSPFLMCLFPFNAILIGIRTIQTIFQQQTIKKIPETGKFPALKQALNNSRQWPKLAFIFLIPFIGVMISILLLFGQEPDSLIKAWTDTADWTFSNKVAPPNRMVDGHYLCTVAAGGHPKIVKPLRIGKRHGHEIIVNRQLSVANAFEQLIQERLPRFHRIVRMTYDKTGYPISKHIQSPFTADFVYFLMKPLEWTFLIVLYLFDASPENRIAVQYPHSNLATFIKHHSEK